MWREKLDTATKTVQPVLYEGTGLYGQSIVRSLKYASEPGQETTPERKAGSFEELSRHANPQRIFGEGITLWGEEPSPVLHQLTWQEHLAYTYDANTLEPISSSSSLNSNKNPIGADGSWAYRTSATAEGWGLTHNGTHLLVSDGSQYIFTFDPVTRKEINKVLVRDAVPDSRVPPYGRPSGIPFGGAISRINELEYCHGWIFANIWYYDAIAVIHPASGNCVAYLDGSELKAKLGNRASADVLNGIACSMRLGPNDDDDVSTDPWGGRVWLTGKLWDTMYEAEWTGLEDGSGAGSLLGKQRRLSDAKKSSGSSGSGSRSSSKGGSKKAKRS